MHICLRENKMGADTISQKKLTVLKLNGHAVIESLFYGPLSVTEL